MIDVSGVRSSWLIRLTNWSLSRSVSRASVMSVPTKFQPACTPSSSLRGVTATDTVRVAPRGGDLELVVPAAQLGEQQRPLLREPGDGGGGRVELGPQPVGVGARG